VEPRDVHELTAAYALDALDVEETEAYEAHLAQCERCRVELAELGEAAGALAFGVASPAPPPALRDRILGAAAAERTNVVPLPVRRPRLLQAVAAVAACAAIGLGTWAAVLNGTQHARVSALAGANGLVAVDKDGMGVLVVEHMRTAPQGKTWEAWVIPKGHAAERAGIFRGGGPTTVVRLGRMVPAGATVAVTLEKAGGVDAPTQTPVASAQA
jgi:anti-sigma-K factor RskA